MVDMWVIWEIVNSVSGGGGEHFADVENKMVHGFVGYDDGRGKEDEQAAK